MNIKKDETIVIDWEKIRTDKDSKKMFNGKLHLSLIEHGKYEPTKGQEYTTFMTLIL